MSSRSRHTLRQEMLVDSMKVYIAILGRSVWALLNTYYVVLRSKAYYPDEIHVFAEKPYERDLDIVKEGLRIISLGFGLKPAIQQDTVSEADFLDAGRKVSLLVKSLKDSGSDVAIEITSGRKAVVAGALISLAQVPVDHVYYLAMASLEDASKPHMMIPLQIQRLKDFVAESEG